MQSLSEEIDRKTWQALNNLEKLTAVTVRKPGSRNRDAGTRSYEAGFTVSLPSLGDAKVET
jgi:hypothetical protein